MPDLGVLTAQRLRRRRRRLRALATLVLMASLAGIAIVLGTGARPGAHLVRGRVPAAPPPVRPAVATVAAAPRGLALGLARIRRLARLGLPVYCAGPRGRDIALTFDDGPGPYTYLALRKLSAAHERATFFDVGRSMSYFPGWPARELAVGVIGDHTVTHPYLPGLTPAAIWRQLAQARTAIQHQTGQRVYLFRPPYGARDAEVDRTARRLGLLEVIWTVDSGDSLGADWARIIATVERGLRPGAIILMHENRGQTIRALTTLLPYLHRHHWRSVSLPELFAYDPPTVAQLRLGARGCGVARSVRTGA